MLRGKPLETAGPDMFDLTRRVAQSFGDKVEVIVDIDATPGMVRKLGTTYALINGKVKIFGPASEKYVKNAIQEEIDQLV